MTLEKIAFAAVSLMIIILLPPLLDGISRKIKATVQERQGPSVFQTYYDLSSLLSMEPMLPTDRLGFLIAPYVAFAWQSQPPCSYPSGTSFQWPSQGTSSSSSTCWRYSRYR
nr:NADH-quinone oxidoreductase subunit H [Thermococcus piezophilus]